MNVHNLLEHDASLRYPSPISILALTILINNVVVPTPTSATTTSSTPPSSPRLASTGPIPPSRPCSWQTASSRARSTPRPLTRPTRTRRPPRRPATMRLGSPLLRLETWRRALFVATGWSISLVCFLSFPLLFYLVNVLGLGCIRRLTEYCRKRAPPYRSRLEGPRGTHHGGEDGHGGQTDQGCPEHGYGVDRVWVWKAEEKPALGFVSWRVSWIDTAACLPALHVVWVGGGGLLTLHHIASILGLLRTCLV